MGKVYEGLDAPLAAWIRRQRVYFVATAPRGDAGHVNLSPKGPIETLRVLGPQRVAYVDLIGSGAETAAHLRENGRIVLMLCAFEGPPRIVRLHGRGRVHPWGDRAFDEVWAEAGFDDLALAGEGARAVVAIDLERVSDSCGYGVPVMEYRHERPQMAAWMERKRRQGPDALARYVAEHNATSVDGLPALDAVPLLRTDTTGSREGI